MLHNYSNMYLPICSVITSILLVILYFPKKKIKNSDNNHYSKLLIFTIIESVYTFALTLCVHLFFNDKTIFWFALANKTLYAVYILWISTLFLYFCSISYKYEKKAFDNFKKATIVLNIILISLIFIAKVELVYDLDGLVSNSYGASSMILYLGCALYILFMIILFSINYKKSKDKRKYIPLWILVFTMIATLIVRTLDPFVNITSNVVSLISLVMFFTIENPDLKMLNELQLARMREIEANKIKSEFLSSMSHEFRTPLNGIAGLSQVISMSDSIEEIKECADDVIYSTSVFLNMFDELQNILKLEANEIEKDNKNYILNAELDKVFKLFDDMIKEKGLTLNKNIPDNVPVLNGSIDIIRRALTNILDNAVKYTKKGSIDFEVKIEPIKNKYKLIFIVKDTGTGINEENLKHLFNKFERGEYKDSNINGLGLGLSITKGLLNIIDGKISVSSKLNVGTTVTIELFQEKGSEL